MASGYTIKSEFFLLSPRGYIKFNFYTRPRGVGFERFFEKIQKLKGGSPLTFYKKVPKKIKPILLKIMFSASPCYQRVFFNNEVSD